MSRESLADRIINYCDALVAFSVVNALAFMIALAEPEARCSIVGIGGFVAMVELPCTGGPYLAITALLARSFDLRAFLYLVVYNVIFVLPLVAILVLIAFGSSTRTLKRWRQTNRRWMNLSMGTLMVGLGGFLVFYYAVGWQP